MLTDHEQPGRGGPPVREFLEVLNHEPDGAGGQEQSDHRGNGYQHRAQEEPGGFDMPPPASEFVVRRDDRTSIAHLHVMEGRSSC